ncbi:AraC family transcriptional regulator [Paenibacillus sp. HN-1]|nr:AraC family transcriptional regulator [Paenibacillus sp. CGMCC 1.18879]MBY9087827.1 AraC family transcriptional regulator [Paenibacillus sinensis]
MVIKKEIREGHNSTILPFLSIIKRSSPTMLRHGVLTPSFCLILQGSKKLYLGQDIINYHAGDYVTSLIDMPASGQTVNATADSPYIGLRIDLSMQEIASVIMEAGIDDKPRQTQAHKAAFVGKSDSPLLDSFIRLMKLLDQRQGAAFLGNLIKREMIYHLLTGGSGHLFQQQIFFNQQAEGIGKAIAWIRDNYASPFTVAELAKMSNMSISGLHHKFKEITTLGPLQYQKSIRLQEARRLMLSESMDATGAAREVGYESPTQFNREYRRMFGLPPLRDVREIRQRQYPVTNLMDS